MAGGKPHPSGRKSKGGSSLNALDLAGNRIGNAGMHALVAAFRSGRLEKLTWLNLLQNPDIDECGVKELTSAVLDGKTANLRRLWLDRPDDHQEFLEACAARGIHINGRGGDEETSMV